MLENIQLLLAIKNNSNFSQRKLANETGMSLGKVNKIVREMTNDKLLTVTQKKSSMTYILTDKGESMLSNSLTNQNEIKIKNIQSKCIDTAVILAARIPGDLKKSTLELEIKKDYRVLDRLIEQFSQQNITKYIFVTDQNNLKLKEYCESKKIKAEFVISNNAKETGTMESLNLVKDLIDTAFILVEGDLVVETRAIAELIANENANAILCTGLSGQHEEAFVDIDSNGYLQNISKDIRQMRNLSVEFIGISKYSYSFFKKLVDEYKNSENEWLNYEYLVNAISRYDAVKCILVDNLIWIDIDDESRYHKLMNAVYPAIKIREDKENTRNIQNIISSVLKLPEDTDIIVRDAGGMTNDNYRVKVNNQYYFVRMPGAGTNEIIIRENEEINSKLASTIGVTPTIFYFNVDSGIKIAEEINGATTLTSRSIKTRVNLKKVSEILLKLHSSNIQFANRYDYLSELKNYEEILKKRFGHFYDGYELTKTKLMLAMDSLEFNSDSPCHVDLVPENFVLDKNESMYLIDWEYSGMTDQFWDLASFCNESHLTIEEIRTFLELYFNRTIEEKEMQKIFWFMAFQNLLWSVWTLNKALEGEDFGSYGISRFKNAEKIVEEYLNA
ncbi:phosphocholine cytidylyltransferase/choline kinase family protein [Latilactobacillus sakei]|uniref:phosphocholine cytidylyltransferase/choline kinase family protein n=1 Tax=Latilactobacillus sakei TaxID=1599 RepID=UPI000C13B81F|nr:phosphocholine cytidylyltransferase/choline kinase family protein [Latilactobacillus sakei]SOB39865.1 putative Choline/ehtanolamine kinase family protein [Latilactobacillus sakei]